MRVPYVSGKEAGENHCLQQFLVPRPALGHFAAGTSETLFLTYFRRLLGAIDNQQRRPNAAWAETSPAASRPRPGARKESPAHGGGGRAPAPPRQPPGRAEERLPEFSCRGAGGQTDTNKSSARHARGPGDRPATEGCPPALPLQEGTDTVPPLCPTTLHPLAAPWHRPGTQRSGRRCPPIARASRGVQAAAAPGWRSAGIRRQRLLLPRRPVPPAPALRWAGREGGRWEPAESRFLLPGAEGRRVPELPPGGLRRRLSRGRC